MGFYNFIVFLVVAGVSLAADYTYYNGPAGAVAPKDWNAQLGDCDGSRQSPIDIDTNDAKFDDDLGEFTMTGGYMTAGSGQLTMTNNGHSLKWSAPAATKVSGGGLDGTYVLEQFHMHWGSAMGNGSEHTMDGKQYEAEIHFVNYKESYGDFTASLAHGDGLAVLGVFVTESGADNAAMAAFLDHLDDIKHAGNETMVDAIKLVDLFPADKSKFYRYEGSLTTPDCNEIVIWTVFHEAITASTAQLEMLRTKMMASDPTIPLIDNWRPVQSLNTREVTASYEAEDDDDKDTSFAVHPVSCLFSVVAAALCAVFFH